MGIQRRHQPMRQSAIQAPNPPVHNDDHGDVRSHDDARGDVRVHTHVHSSALCLSVPFQVLFSFFLLQSLFMHNIRY